MVDRDRKGDRQAADRFFVAVGDGDGDYTALVSRSLFVCGIYRHFRDAVSGSGDRDHRAGAVGEVRLNGVGDFDSRRIPPRRVDRPGLALPVHPVVHDMQRPSRLVRPEGEADGALRRRKFVDPRDGRRDDAFLARAHGGGLCLYGNAVRTQGVPAGGPAAASPEDQRRDQQKQSCGISSHC